MGGNLVPNGFVFTTVSDGTVAASDITKNFVHGKDVFDFSSIDANSSHCGDRAVAFSDEKTSVGSNGALWFAIGESTFIEADLNGDAIAVLKTILAGPDHSLTATDFIL